MWRPFGSRRVLHVLADDTTAQIRARGIQYLLVTEQLLIQRHATTFDNWLRERPEFKLVKQFRVEYKAARGPEQLYLVQLLPEKRD
jgi:hypothetical protein